MATRFESYTEAVRFLNEAADAIDQAHACMKGAGIEGIEVRTGIGQVRCTGIAALSDELVTEMEKEVRTAYCDDCGYTLSRHDDSLPGGCEWGRVDPAKQRKGA